ncbi:mediator of RNA polymerase II transcription subunit 13 [Lithohypha guttulata]|uniref:mediator of RNA polymerase II transcription subunit 13 n=1 Tax=Lithohypha guttulata TaxID=1690604 RepID=UPI00315D3820
MASLAICRQTRSAPATSDQNSNVQDSGARNHTLPRLRNAEQQFRQASILTSLDVERLELFTFYKKVDIVKDQKTILTKFTNICKLNNCVIASKNACQVMDLLKPDMFHVYRLFTSAIISSLHLSTAHEHKMVKVNSQIYLLPARSDPSLEWNPLEHEQTRWILQKLDLHVIASGHLVLVVRHSKWPSLIAMPDLINPIASPLDHSKGTSLYLVPTGQLAMYRGMWSASVTPEQEHFMARSGSDSSVWKKRWLEIARDWLSDKTEHTTHLQAGTIWLEVDIPVLQSDDENHTTKDFVWKTVHWPAALSYAFCKSLQATGKHETDTTDPFKIARDWFLQGAADAVQTRHHDHIVDFHAQTDEHFFDDEPPFGSPQQSMSLPMQNFAPTVYPTPPEAFNTQPTPGMSIDGGVQTPASNLQPPMNHNFSSPFTMMTDTGLAGGNEQAISNFLQHNEDDDLFDDLDEAGLGDNTFADEPDWDFFNQEAVQPERRDSHVQVANSSNNDEELEQKNDQVEDVGMDAIRLSEKSTSHEADKISSVPSQEQSHTNLSVPAHSPLPLYEPPLMRDTTSPNLEVKDEVFDPRLSTTRPNDYVPSGKRRRSSVYDIDAQYDTTRDQKYGTHGKFCFEPTRYAGTRPAAIVRSVPRRPSSSVSSTSSLSDDNLLDSKANLAPTHPWTHYEPVRSAMPEESSGREPHDAIDHDAEIHALLDLIGTASGLEPFLTRVQTQTSIQQIKETDPERFSMVLQMLTEQLALSTIFRGHQDLRVPGVGRPLTLDITMNDAGVNTTLVASSLADLASLQHPSVPARVESRITSLKPTKLRFMQANSEIIAKSPILGYWETLSLQPLNGSKEVMAVCLHPESDGYRLGCESFLQRMTETWDSCNLGQHRKMMLEGLSDTGTIAWKALPDLHTLCQKIGNGLADDVYDDCTVIYVVVPEDDLSLCFQLCDAFVELFETLELSRQSDGGDITLQLVPSSFIVGCDTISVPSEAQFVDLAIEVYHRVPPTEHVSNTASWAPAFVLEEPIPLHLQFDLSSKSVSPLEKHGKCCHLAYCLTLDTRWLIATWSDSIGSIAMSMSYSLSEDKENATTRSDVFRHICETSAALMNDQRGTWWFVIAKVGMYEMSELQDWSTVLVPFLEEQKLLGRTMLLSADLQPRLAFSSSALLARQSQNQTAAGQNTLGTPVSTPQATSTTSPEQTIPATPTSASAAVFAASAQTPPDTNMEAGNDNDIFLSDPTEDSWMMILPFGLNPSYLNVEVRPSLNTGFLLKKTISEDKTEVQMALLSVDLILIPRNQPSSTALLPQEREQLLEEVLLQYRGLHTLAVARNFIEPSNTCAPWHIASAYKSAKVLDMLV